MRTLGWMMSEELPMPKSKPRLSILCDTSFLIRLNNPKEKLHANARGYLKYFLSEEHRMFVSTIALAEYAVRDKIKTYLCGIYE